jgi:hypothetical protein
MPLGQGTPNGYGRTSRPVARMGQDGLANEARPRLSLLGLQKINGGECRLVDLGEMIADVIEQHDAFLDAADHAVEAVFDVLRHAREQAVSGESVPRVTAEPRAVAVLELRQNAVAFGAGVRGQLAEFHDPAFERAVLRRDLDFDLHLFVVSHHLLRILGHSLLRQPDDQARHLGNRDAVINCDFAERVFRHRRHFRIPRVLHQSQPAAVLDRPKPGRPVVECAGQNHADYA